MRALIAPAAGVAALALLCAVPSVAGPDKIAFPAKYKDGVLYTTVDRYDIKQYRELYGTADAVAAMKAGRALPDGSVLTLVQYKALVDAAGAPVKSPDGRFVKGDLIAYTVMEKRAGFGVEYPAALRNGDWEYAAFGADMKLNEKANYRACFECHKPHEKTDFVISHTKLVAAAAPKPAAPDIAAAVVNIEGFKFGPAKLAIDKGMQVLWTNEDDSPHQIAVTTGTITRSPVLAKGQRHVQTFATPGTYDYSCALHPSMKGQLEVR
jgi:plastocyanin